MTDAPQPQPELTPEEAEWYQAPPSRAELYRFVLGLASVLGDMQVATLKLRLGKTKEATEAMDRAYDRLADVQGQLSAAPGLNV